MLKRSDGSPADGLRADGDRTEPAGRRQAPAGRDAARADTLPRLLRRNAETMAAKPALREKTRGIWQTYSWADYHAEVCDFAAGLATLGFGRGDKLAVIGDNRPRLYVAQLAAQLLGGIAVPLYQDAIASELAYVLDHAEASVVVAEDQEQVDKILAIRGRLPRLEHLLYDDPRGLMGYRQPGLRAFADVQADGRKLGEDGRRRIAAAIDAGSPDDIAAIVYTSGTTGRPKGAMVAHRNLIAMAGTAAEIEGVKASDNWLSYLPMAWMGDVCYTTALGLVSGCTCNFPESPETVQRDLRELGPTQMLAPPRIWENMLTSVLLRAGDATPLKRRAFELFRRVAEEAEALRSEGKPVPLGLRLGRLVGEFVIYGPIRDQLGLGRARWAYTGGAPLGADTFRFFRAFGVNLKQVYGSTECSALVTAQSDGDADPATVGRPVPGVDVRVDEHGEVLVKGPGVFPGYYKNEQATREAIDEDGWFHTGDAGLFDARGNLVIVDRAGDVGKLTCGTPFAPQFVENKLKFSPFIREAIAFGDQRSCVTAMIAINLDAAGSWAERKGLPYTSYQDLSQKPEVRELVRVEIEKCNTALPAVTRVRRFLLLPKDFDADDDEITRTRKLRRRHIAEKYAPAIAALYDGAGQVELVTEATFEDGRRATLRAQVVIEDVREPAHV